MKIFFNKNIDMLMHLKNENRPLYFQCLSILILYSYSSFDFDLDILGAINDYRNELIDHYGLDENNEVLKEFPFCLIQNGKEMDNILDEKELLCICIKTAKNIEEFDRYLEESDSYYLLDRMIRDHVDSIVECNSTLNAFGMMNDLKSIKIYKKYIAEDIVNAIIEQAVFYMVTEDSYALVDFIEQVDEQTESKEKAYLMHKYIIKKYNNENYSDGITNYISDMMWMMYIRGLIGNALQKSSEELSCFVRQVEKDSNYIFDIAKDLLNVNKNTSSMFNLFIENYFIGDFGSNHNELEGISFNITHEDGEKMKQKVHQYVKSQSFLKMD